MNLLIRLSDEQSWACEPFGAVGVESLRDGCLEAFAQLRAEWTARGAHEIPPHRTHQRARHESLRPHSLQVQVCYHGEWSAQPWTPVIREPGSVPDSPKPWIDEDWADAWARCERTFRHVDGFGKLVHWVSRS